MEDCISKAEHEEFRKRLDSENDRQNHRIDRLENMVEKINVLATSTEKLATNMEMMLKEQERQNKEQERQREQLNALQNSGGKKWDDVKKMVLQTVISVVVAAVAVMIGLKV